MLRKCNAIYGGATIIPGAPEAPMSKQALVVPQSGKNGEAGIYDMSGKRLAESYLYRGVPKPGPISHSSLSLVNPLLVKTVAPEGRYVFIGPIYQHYGHFLVSTLSRFWHPVFRQQDVKIIYTGPAPIRELFEIDFIREIFQTFGLSEASFVEFPEPTIVKNVVTPAPSFNENMSAYGIFTELCNKIGQDVIKKNGTGPERTKPIYLTKEFLPSGVSHTVNEPIFTNVLRQKDVEIIAPEKLSFVEQVQLFHCSQVISGTVGSAFHSALFAPPGRYLILNYASVLWTNQLMIDRSNGNTTISLHPGESIFNNGTDGKFGNNYEFRSPVELAIAFWHCIRAMYSVERHSRKMGVTEESCDPIEPIIRPLGSMISAGKPTKTGSNPYGSSVRIDLQGHFRISGIRFYGANALNFRILLSDDGVEFRPVATISSGFDNNPHIWFSSEGDIARFVRISVIADTPKFDGIEVYGEPKDEVDAVLETLKAEEVFE